MNRHEDEVDTDVAKQILRYFSRNPEATDTLEGVARWRLLDETIQSNLETVMRVMAWLVSEGVLVKESRPGSAPLFRLNSGETQKIQTLLSDPQGEHKSKKGNP